MNAATGATRIGNFRTVSVSRELNGQPCSTDANVLRLVGANKRVLELGCGSGHMSNGLREQGCTVIGIEIDAEAAKAAASVCERVIVGDLDYLDFEDALGADRFDVIAAADVLEHLKDPLSVLQAVKRFLLPHGYVVISVPNVAHISVRLALLAGQFPYGETGLLDRTHLRFLTRESLEQLMEGADLAIGHFERISNVPTNPTEFEVPYDPAILPPDIVDRMSQDPEALTYQFVVSGYPLPQSGLLFVQNRIRHLAHEVDAAQNEAKHLRMSLQSAQLLHETAAAELETSRKEMALLQEQVQSLLQSSTAMAAENDAEKRTAALLEEQVQLRDQQMVLLQEQVQSLLHSSSAMAAENDAEKRTAALLEEQVQLRDQQIDEQKHRIAGLQAHVDRLLNREKDLRDMLLDAHDQLSRRDEEIALTLASTIPQTAGPSPDQKAPAAGGKYLFYQQLIQKIREVVCRSVPDGANVLVVSKGDDDLLKVEPCRASHFPQQEDGRYSGYYPVDGAAALEHLKALKSRGAQMFLIPQTAFWWLEHYPELADYLTQHCTRVIDEPDVCLLFDLNNAKESPQIVASSVPAARPFGVNIAGNITSEKGVGEAVRGQARSLAAAGIPIVLNNVVEDTAFNGVNEFTDFANENPYAVNLIHLNADALSDFVESHDSEYFKNRYNIGFWAWETSKFPDQWWRCFQYLDEIWVGSDFVLDAVSRVSPIPVIKTPLAVPGRSSVVPHGRSHFGLNDGTFIFLFVFDYMSIVQRKNPLGLVQAFRNAFRTRENVTLVLKCNHSEAYVSEARMLKEECRGANIKIIDTVFSREEMNSLMKAADCYVSLHRSEGFGITMAEAMSFGKPVIATGFSGNLEFMTDSNSYLVKYALTEIDKPYGPYREGHWAEPDLDHASQLMRFVFKNRAAAKEIGRRGRSEIVRRYSPLATGTLMRNRLARIAQLGQIPSPETESAEPSKSNGNGIYHHLVERIRDTVQTTLPSDVRIAVVSRGDDDLLSFEGRDAWHFPQTIEGKYAGYHPANGAEAIGHLETVRERGAEYWLLPQTAFWWMDHYAELRAHLESRYRRVWSSTDCVIYRLQEKRNGVVTRFRERLAKRWG